MRSLKPRRVNQAGPLPLAANRLRGPRTLTAGSIGLHGIRRAGATPEKTASCCHCPHTDPPSRSVGNGHAKRCACLFLQTSYVGQRFGSSDSAGGGFGEPETQGRQSGPGYLSVLVNVPPHCPFPHRLRRGTRPDLRVTISGIKGFRRPGDRVGGVAERAVPILEYRSARPHIPRQSEAYLIETPRLRSVYKDNSVVGFSLS